MADPVRKNFDLGERYVYLLAHLKEKGGLTSEKDVIEEALVFLGWAIAEVAEGRSIGSFDPKSERMKEIVMRSLANAKRDWTT